MKKYLLSLMVGALALSISTAAFANGRELANHRITELDTLAVDAVDPAADYIPVLDATDGRVKKVLATGTVGIGGITSSATELNYNDITLLGTLAASKAWTSDAALDTIMPTGGLLTVQSGGAITLNSGATLTAGGTLETTGAITSTGTMTSTRTTSADSGTTNKAFAVALTAPVDTTGTNTHTGYDFAATVSNATAGTNTVNGFNFANYTGDAQVNVNALKIGTSDGLGTAYGVNIGTGWDAGIQTASPVVNTYASGADSGTTTASSSLNFTYPVDTTGTNTHNLLTMALTAANATGGTNTVNGMNFANYTGDAQVNVNAINIGTSDGLGTANAIKIGTGWDAGIVTDSGVQINSTNGTVVTAFRVASDTVASGQTSKTVTVTGATASSKCVAQANEVPSNAVYIKSAAPGTDQVVITTSGDPGASNLDLTVMCVN